MKFFELWMDPMFFVHLILFIASIVLFFRFFMLFKHVCDMEQQGKLSGGRSPKKENGEEPEQEPELPREQEQESAEYDEADDSTEDENSYEDETGSSEYASAEMFTGKNTGTEDEEEEPEEDESAETTEEKYAEETPAEKTDMIHADAKEYDSIKSRVAMTEKNINAAQKGFREMVDRLTDLERRLNNIPVQPPVEKSDFAEAVNNTLEEIQERLNDINKEVSAKDGAASADELSELKEQIKDLSEKISAMPAKEENTEKPADSEEMEHLLKEVISLKEQNDGLEASLKATQEKAAENSRQNSESMLKIQEELKALREDMGSLPAPQPVEESEAFKQLRKALDESKNRAGETEKRIAVLEEELQDNMASHEYTVEYLENIIGDFDKMDKDEIRIKLKQLKQDLTESYPNEGNGEE